MKIIAITQARIGSTRLPGKVLSKIDGKSLLQIHLERLMKSKLIDRICVATTNEDGSEAICDIAKSLGHMYYKGSVNDVLDRFYRSVEEIKPDYVVRITSDCPLLDAELMDQVIQHTVNSGVDYGANNLIEEFPDGQDTEVFKFSVLEKAWSNAKLVSEREHVTPYIRKNSDFNQGQLFTASQFRADKNYNHIRMTVDEKADLDMMEEIISTLGHERTWKEYVDYISKYSNILKNQSIIRNEGYIKSLSKDNQDI